VDVEHWIAGKIMVPAHRSLTFVWKQSRMPHASDPSSLAQPDGLTDHVRSVVFFDGICGLCNVSVDFILARDIRQRFQFAPLQGETARRELSPADLEHLDTMILRTARGTYRRSAAVVRILWELPGIWPVIGALLWMIPWPLRDVGYRIVSANRITWFGKNETCRFPTPEERERFLP
jgi:predicted DCC family thiol-disulfide oxidoreductase YuxK